MLSKFKTAGRKGSILIVAILLLFVMLTLCLALITQENIARQLFLSSRAGMFNKEALFVSQARFEDTFQYGANTNLPQIPLTGKFSVPSFEEDGFIVSGSFSDDSSVINPAPNKFGKDYESVPYVGFSPGTSSMKTGYRGIKVAPWQNMIVTGSNTFERKNITVYSSMFPYGAYAPNGSITLKDAIGWANPTMDEDKEARQEAKAAGKDFTEIFSGIPVDLYAGSTITVSDFRYGKAYSVNGPVNIAGGGVGFSGVSPLPDYASAIQSQINNAYDELKKDTLDKTFFLTGTPLSIKSVFYMIFNPSEFKNYDIRSIFSLEQAMRFPFLTIPTFSSYGVMHVLMLHVPYPPDNAMVSLVDLAAELFTDTNVNDLMAKVGKIMELLGVKMSGEEGGQEYYTKWDILIGMSKLEKARYMYESGMRLAGYEPDRDNINDALNKLVEMKHNPGFSEFERQQATNALDAVYLWSQMPDKPEGIMLQYYEWRKKVDDYIEEAKKKGGGNAVCIPRTRGEEKEYEKTKQYIGYPYAQVLIKMGSVIWGTLKLVMSGDFESIPGKISEIFVSEIRVVHFEDMGEYFITFVRKDNKEGSPATGIFMPSTTWVIPRGRTLKLKKDVHVNKLWIQDGATLYLNGNLEVENQTYLGQGSHIITSGYGLFHGTQLKGTIWVNSPAGMIHPITSSIMCKGRLTITNGIYPGITPGAIATKLVNDDRLEKYVNVLFDMAPVAAKVAGPFHKRFAYFAEYPATIRVVQILFVPVAFPSPTPTKNVNRKIFKIVTFCYATELNAMMGEYLFTHTDWWKKVFGSGNVPILPKIDPEATFDQITKIDFGALPDPSEVLNFSKDLVKNIGEDLITDLTVTITTQLAVKIASFIAVSLGGEAVAYVADLIIERLMDELFKSLGINNPDGSVFPGTDNNSFMSAIFETYINAQVAMYNFIHGLIVFNEVPGILCYSEEGIDLGGPTSSGLIICKKDVNLLGDRVVGSVVSLEGNIHGPNTKLRYYPYFTRASLYVPKKADIWENLILITGNQLKSGKDPMPVGFNYYHRQMEGWDE